MVKRIVAAPLWFVSTWLMYGLVAYFLGIPETGGAIVGADDDAVGEERIGVRVAFDRC